MSLDLDAAVRQTLATSFRPEEVESLLQGRLTMAPHPEWTLPAEPTWREDPFHDRNWCFQFHMLRWLEPLRRAAAKGDDAAYAMWLTWVRDWVEKNPPASPRSKWAWTDMSDGIRAQQLCMAAPMVSERSPDLLGWLEQAIRTHADHLVDPRNMGNANHALHQQESLFIVGRVLGEDHLTTLALTRMGDLLREQYDEQGVNAEGAIAYHYNNYLWWERTLERIDIEGMERPEGASRHHAAPEEIAHATRPDGTLVTIGDTDPMSPAAIASEFIAHATSDGSAGKPPADTARVYESGYVFGRSGWGDSERPFSQQTFYSLRFGPSGTVHGHPDGTSVTFSAAGTNWVVDPGKYQYGSSVPRDHFFSRAAHSLVAIEGKRPRRGARVDLVRADLGPDFHDLLVADHSFRGIALTRRLLYSVHGEYLVVIDDVAAQGRTRVSAVQRWQLGPDVHAEVRDGCVQLDADDRLGTLCFLGAPVTIETVRGSEDPFDGWVSTGWKKKTPATAVSATQKGTRLRFVTVLAVGTGTRPSTEALHLHEERVVLKVDTGAVSEQVRITADGAGLVGTSTR